MLRLDSLPAADKVATCLNFHGDLKIIENRLANRLLYPSTQAISREDLAFDQAIFPEQEKKNPIFDKLTFDPSNLLTNYRPRTFRGAIIHFKKFLPKGGLIRVSVGEEIGPSDILGEGKTISGFHTINLAQDLQVNPAQALSYLKCPLGKNIYQGELLASCPSFMGLSKKQILSPVDGIVDFYDQKSGDLRLKLLPKSVKTISGVFGIVDQIDQINGTILIRTKADLVYGVMGSGKDREGTLNILGSSGDLVAARHINFATTGQILVAGAIAVPDVLTKAMTLKVPGIICGGINVSDFKTLSGDRWTDVGFSLMLTEGFGPVSIGEDIFSLFREHQGRFVSLDGNLARLVLPILAADSMIYIRKTRLPVALGLEQGSKPQPIEIKLGQKARVISSACFGVQGVVEAIDQSPTLLPSGISTHLVTLLTKWKRLRVPYLNLEVIN